MPIAWPGNARELRSVVHYALNMTDSDVINPSDLPHYLLLSEGRASLNKWICPDRSRVRRRSARGFIYRDVMDAFEKDLIEVILNRYPKPDKGDAGSGPEPQVLLPQAQKTWNSMNPRSWGALYKKGNTRLGCYVSIHLRCFFSAPSSLNR